MHKTAAILLILFASALAEKNVGSKRSAAIFWAPFPFLGSKGISQLKILMSITQMNYHSHVYMLGNHYTFFRVADEFPNQVTVCSDVDFTARGTPIFNSVFYKTRMMNQTYTVLMSAELTYFGNLDVVVNEMEMDRATNPFVAFSFVKHSEFKCWRKYGKRKLCRGIGFWIWKKGENLLFNVTVPPFALFHGKYDQWFAREVSASGHHSLLDISSLIDLKWSESTRIKKGDFKRMLAKIQRTNGSELSKFPSFLNGSLSPIKWRSHRKFAIEISSNQHLMDSTLKNHSSLKQTLSNYSLYKLTSCHRGNSSKCTLQKLICDGADDKESQWGCNLLLANESRIATSSLTKFGSLEGALRANANANKTVIMTGGSYSYKEMIMNFVCTLRRLTIQNPIVISFEEEMYHFGTEMGLAMVYQNVSDLLVSTSNGTENSTMNPLNSIMDPLNATVNSTMFNSTANSTTNATSFECVFGTDCFKRVTKLKSYFVLKALKLGYNILWSDADVAWFKDPLPEIYSYGPNVLPIQSDTPGYGDDIIETTILNSGFYLARAEASVMAAFESIVEIARTTNTSEQPTFTHVLCGEEFEGNKRIGRFDCYNSKLNLTTKALPKPLYPNGNYLSFFNETGLCHGYGCFVIHNNYIMGWEKIPRFKKVHLWYYNDGFSCTY